MWNAPPEVPEVSPAVLERPAPLERPAQTASFAPAAPVGTGLYGVDNTGQTWQYVPPGVIPLVPPTTGGFLPLTGGQMLGPLLLAGDPVVPLGAATKAYVDAAVGIGGGPFLPLSGGTIQGPAPNHIVLAPLDPNAPYTNGTQSIFSYYVAAGTGGTTGDVVDNARIYSSITGAPNAYIFNLTAVADYAGTGGNGELVPIYAQGIRRTQHSGGATNNPQIWAGVFECIDFTNTDSAQTNNMSGLEIDMTCGNTDSANTRRALGIYLNHANAGDATPVCGTGIHLAANLGSYNTPIKIQTPFNIAAIDLRQASASTGSAHQIWLGNAGTIAMDTSASVALSGDGTGGLVVAGASGQPAIVKYQSSRNWWSGAWSDNNFYIGDNTSSTDRVTITPTGAITLNGATTTNTLALSTAGNTISLDPSGTVTLQNLSGHLASNKQFDINSGASNPAITTYNGAQTWWTGCWMDGSYYISGGTPSSNVVTIGSNHAITFNGSAMGFNNATPVTKPTVTGAKGGNAALASLLTALASYGLVTDSTT